jgi:hypothetical protein
MIDTGDDYDWRMMVLVIPMMMWMAVQLFGGMLQVS